jgi:hypothetical protein
MTVRAEAPRLLGAAAPSVAGARRTRQWPSHVAIRVLVLLCIGACLADPTDIGSRSQPLPAALAHGRFVIDVAGDSLLRDSLIALGLKSQPSGDHDILIGQWARVDSIGLAPESGSVVGTRSGHHWHLAWVGGGGDSASFDGDETASFVTGQLRVGGGVASGRLLPLDLDSARTNDESLAGWFDPGARAVVAIRVDDSRDSDRTFIPELAQRQLMGEFAIITARVGTPGFLRWNEVIDLENGGYGIVAHSRLHAPGALSLGAFTWEVVGSKSDLLAHGLSARALAIPGVWLGASYLDSFQKIRSARGRLAREFYTATYAWVYPLPQDFPVADSVDLGITHVTADRASLQTTMTAVRAAVNRRAYTQVLFHSYLADKTIMRAVLDSIATLRDQGLVNVVSSVVGLAAQRDGAPKLRSAGGGPLGSSNVSLREAVPGACRATAASLDSTSIALDNNCELWLKVRNPPRGTAVALEGTWTATGPDDSLRLDLIEDPASAHAAAQTCAAAAAPRFCSVRFGVLERNTTVIGVIRRLGDSRGTARLSRAALSIQ